MSLILTNSDYENYTDKVRQTIYFLEQNTIFFMGLPSWTNQNSLRIRSSDTSHMFIPHKQKTKQLKKWILEVFIPLNIKSHGEFIFEPCNLKSDSFILKVINNNLLCIWNNKVEYEFTIY